MVRVSDSMEPATCWPMRCKAFWISSWFARSCSASRSMTRVSSSTRSSSCLALQLDRQRAQALGLVLTVRRQLLGLRQLQHEQRIARLLEVLRHGVAQAFRVFRLAVADAVREAVQTVVEVLEHGQVLFLEHRRDHLGKVGVAAQQRADPERDPEHRNQRDPYQRRGESGQVAEIHAGSIRPGARRMTT